MVGLARDNGSEWWERQRNAWGSIAGMHEWQTADSGGDGSRSGRWMEEVRGRKGRNSERERTLVSGIGSNNRAMAVELHFDTHGDGGVVNPDNPG